MNNKYKLLILDYGGVYSFDYVASNFNKIMLDAFGKLPDEEEKQKIIYESQKLGKNAISATDYVCSVGGILGVSKLPTVERFEEITISVTNPPSKEMKDLVANTRKAGIKVSLLSDMYMFEVKRTRPWGRYEGFDYVSFSAEVGMTKFDPEFFRQTLNYFSIDAKEALFVDDTLKNIEVAQSAGLVTLYANKEKYVSVDQLVNDIYGSLIVKN